MAAVELTCRHALARQEARRRTERFADGVQQRLGLVWHRDGDVILFAAGRGMARGTRGYIVIGADEVRVCIELPLLLRAMRRAVRGRAEELLRETFVDT